MALGHPKKQQSKICFRAPHTQPVHGKSDITNKLNKSTTPYSTLANNLIILGAANSPRRKKIIIK